MRKPVILAAVCLVAVSAIAASPDQAGSGPKKATAKNIVIMISDGWGFEQIEAASFYRYGKSSRQVFNRFPFNAAASTYMAYRSVTDPCHGVGYDPQAAWNDFSYVLSCATDSAAAATALSTGAKTYGGAVGVDLDQQPSTHALEIAEQKGKATGVITSVEWSHATPAAFVAHNVSRNNYAAIAQEMVYDSATDVVMGVGHPWFGHDGQPLSTPNTFKYVGGATTWDGLVAGTAGGDADGDGVDDPWTLIQTRAEFQALGNGPTPRRVLGTAQVYQTLQQLRSGDGFADPYVVPRIDTVPTLEEMTKAALNILDDDPDGLFLMVEGGAVDWAAHGGQSGRMIEEQIDFENAVEAVVSWVRMNSNWGETLLIVTGDHETGCLAGPGSDPTWEPIVNNGAGNLPGMEWHSTGHTNSLIAVSAMGDTARLLQHEADESDPVRGPYLDNAELGQAIKRAMDAEGELSLP